MSLLYKSMDLIYGQIRIRRATSEDAQTLTNWWNDGHIMAHAGFPKGLGITVEEVTKQLEPGSLMLLCRDVPIGELHYRKAGECSVEIGIKICDTDYQNKGLGKIALSMLIQELFRWGYQTIILDTNLSNTRAQHVYEALGFQKIRINHHSWKNQLGQLQSSVDYKLSESDFRNYLSGENLCRE